MAGLRKNRVLVGRVALVSNRRTLNRQLSELPSILVDASLPAKTLTNLFSISTGEDETNLRGSRLSEASQIPQLLASARELESACEWLSATQYYESCFGLVQEKEKGILGEIHEKIGYGMYRAARQAETADGFTQRMKSAISSYEKAKAAYGESYRVADGRASRCFAMIAFLNSWLSHQRNEKVKLLEECWESTQDALEKFSRSQEFGEYWTTYSWLGLSLELRYAYEQTRTARELIARCGLRYAEQSIRHLSTTQEPRELAKAHAAAHEWLRMVSRFQRPDEQEEIRNRYVEHWTKAVRFSEETALVELAGLEAFLLEWLGIDEALEVWKRGVDYCKKTKDRLITGRSIANLAFLIHWKAASSEDEEQARAFISKAVEYVEEVKRLNEPIGYVSPFTIPWPESYRAYICMALVRYVETDPDRRSKIIVEGLESCPAFLQRASDLAGPEMIMLAHYTYGSLLWLRAKAEENPEEKHRLLMDAFQHEKEALKLVESVLIYGDWGIGVGKNALADIKSEIADLSKEPTEKIRLLLEAAQDKRESIRLCANEISLLETNGPLPMMQTVSRFQYEQGNLLISLYEVTHDRDHLRNAAEAYRDASGTFERAELLSRAAECYWKLALLYNEQGDSLQASEEFLHSSDKFGKAAEKLPRLRDIYQDYAKYMMAWSEISRARYYHEREEYTQSRNHYNSAASLHMATKAWGYLASNYFANAKLEEAEDTSRREDTDHAAGTFSEAAQLFEEARSRLRKQLGLLENQEEKAMVSKLVRAIGFRTKYCRARVILEDARILNKKGDRLASSRKFGEVAQKLEDMMNDSEGQQAEVRLIATLARAWEKMTLAEAEASPRLYLEASLLFERAKELSPNEKSKMLALGHSRFCKALEAGARFIDTRDEASLAEARQHLETAADYYLKTGFPSTSEYAKGTEFLLEAYMFMVDASKAKDHLLKEKLYKASEKVLEESAASFMKAQYSAKRDEVRRLLERVREGKQLAKSLAELLQTPLTASTPVTFAPPGTRDEEAVGLERFEQADILAELSVTRRSLRVGERVEISIDLVNAGRGLAQLVKIDEALPVGFEILETPEKCYFKDRSLETRGKRIGPLKTERIRIIVQPKVPGISAIGPEIRYIDEAGAYKTCRPKPVDIVVSEPYLPEWLRGPGPPQIPASFRFETDRTKGVFQQLAVAFREDYVLKGLFVEKAGWRSFMQIVRDTRVPRSSFYGLAGRRGPVLSELERLGLAEVRVFPEERGRGGQITKIRLAYEKVILKASQ